LKKAAQFVFDDEYCIAYETFKKELTSYPVLRLYNPATMTELHTDVSAVALAGIFLQQNPGE